MNAILRGSPYRTLQLNYASIDSLLHVITNHKKQKVVETPDMDLTLIFSYKTDKIHQALQAANPPPPPPLIPQGATAAHSIQASKRFVFQEVAQFVDLDICGVEQHPITARDMGDYYCQTVLHHLTNQQYDRIRRHPKSNKLDPFPCTTHSGKRALCAPY